MDSFPYLRATGMLFLELSAGMTGQPPTKVKTLPKYISYTTGPVKEGGGTFRIMSLGMVHGNGVRSPSAPSQLECRSLSAGNGVRIRY